jgi:hypothetical protein
VTSGTIQVSNRAVYNKNHHHNNNNNYIIQLFIIYVPSQQLQGELQTQHNADTGNCIMDKQNMKSKTNYRHVLEEKHVDTEK